MSWVFGTGKVHHIYIYDVLYYDVYDIYIYIYINGVSSNPVEGRTKIWQLKNLIPTLFGLIFRRMYI